MNYRNALLAASLVVLAGCSGTQEPIDPADVSFLNDLVIQTQDVPKDIADSKDVSDDVKAILETVSEESKTWADKGKEGLDRIGETIRNDDGLRKLGDKVEEAVTQVAKDDVVAQTRAYIDETIEERKEIIAAAQRTIDRTTNAEVLETARAFVKEQTKLIDELSESLNSLK